MKSPGDVKAERKGKRGRRLARRTEQNPEKAVEKVKSDG